MQTPSFVTPQRVSAGLAVLRVVLGIIFIAHGAQKFFVFGIEGAINAFGQMGVPLNTVTAPLVAVLELFGGAALIIGLLTRVIAAGLALDMLGAILFVKAKGGFFSPNGVEFELILFGAAVALALTGAGAFSVDAALVNRRRKRAAS